MKRLLCFLLGHRWAIVMINPFVPPSIWRQHSRGMRHCAAFCTRCSETWDDMPGWYDRLIGAEQPLPFDEWRKEMR